MIVIIYQPEPDVFVPVMDGDHMMTFESMDKARQHSEKLEFECICLDCGCGQLEVY